MIELNHFIGRLYFKKDKVKILGAVPSERIAKQYAEFIGNGMNSVVFISAPNSETLFLSEERLPNRLGIGMVWKPFERAVVYDCHIDCKAPLESLLWKCDVEKMIRGAITPEASGCVLQAPSAPEAEPELPDCEPELEI